MGKMDKKICLDTSVCIELVKGNTDVKSELDSYLGAENFISSITVFELFLRKTNLLPIEKFIRDFEIVSIDENIAKKASFIFKDAEKIGRPMDIRDIFIAATCIMHNLEFITLNRKDFEHIRELKLAKI